MSHGPSTTAVFVESGQLFFTRYPNFASTDHISRAFSKSYNVSIGPSPFRSCAEVRMEFD